MVLAASACTRRADGGVSGERVDACTGIRIYNSLDAPLPDDPESMERYAADVVKVLSNVNPRYSYKNGKGDNKDVPAALLADIEVVEQRMRRFRAEVADGDGAAALTAAASSLAADVRFTEAERRVQEFLKKECGG